MIKEKSCGAVVYKPEDGAYLFLLERMKLGHISIPKGHVEEDESEEETALREIKEETNLDVVLDAGFRRVVSYSPYPGCVKDVVFFVAKAKEHAEPRPQECEVTGLLWAPYPEAKTLLTYDSDRQVLEDAYNYLNALHQRLP